MFAGQRRPAFSLLELGLVLLIVAILASMAIPRFSGAATRQRADAAARRIISDLTLAREHARQSSTSQTVIFDVAANGYRLPGLPDPDHPTSEYEVDLDEEPYRAAIVSVDFGGTANVLFDGFGVPAGDAVDGGTIVIRVGAEQRTITLDPDTGEASVTSVILVPVEA